jgi:hypothetical protein
MSTLTPTARRRIDTARQLARLASPTLRAYATRLALAPAGEWEAMMYDTQALSLVEDVAAGMAIDPGERRAAVALVTGLACALAGSLDTWRGLAWVRQVAGLRRCAAILQETAPAAVAREDRYAVVDGGEPDPWQMAA